MMATFNLFKKAQVQILLALCLFLYVIIPLLVLIHPGIFINILIFGHHLRWPLFIDFTKPADYGLNRTHNFYVRTDKGVNIGAWHTLPASLSQDGDIDDPSDYEDLLSSGKKTILYLHGNSGTRGVFHRVELCKLLASLDFHVVSFDYRGFGDSSGTPTEDGVVHDSYFMYRWIKERNNGEPVFLWGHSLGSAITTKLAKKLSQGDEHASGVILEAPFNNIGDAAVSHPLAIPYRLLPWFTTVFVDELRELGIHFRTDEHIAHVSPPILILHAEDDGVVPFHLGEKLFTEAKQSRPDHHGFIELKRFNSHHGYGHKHIYLAPDLPEIIRKFVEDALKKL